MNRLSILLLIWLLFACKLGPDVPGPIPPPAIGGSVSTGGTVATGGAEPAGGSTLEGGAGSAAVIRWPECRSRSIVARGVEPRALGLRFVERVARPRMLAPQIVQKPQSVLWRPNPCASAMPINQANVGACGGFCAAALWGLLPRSGCVTDADGFRAYQWATEHDPFDGSWPAQDTGTTLDAAMSAGLEFGWFANLQWPTNASELATALQNGPCGIGVRWHDGMFEPDCDGRLHVTGKVVGGHAFAVNGYDRERDRFWAINSWGNNFGACVDAQCGYMYLNSADVNLLLQTGDAACPIP